MAIDDPVSALQDRYTSEERQRSPVSRYTKPFLTIAKILAPPGTEFTFDAAVEWLSGRTESKWQDFVDVFAGEMQYCTAKVQKLICENEAQRRFIEDELPGLTVEALRRAEECRAKERVARLAQILSHAASTGARDGADLIEDMMAVATRLSELDVLVLQDAVVEYKAETSAHPQEAGSTLFSCRPGLEADSRKAQLPNFGRCACNSGFKTGELRARH